MDSPTIQFPELVGKTIKEISIYDDALFGREVLARYCVEDTPDKPIFVRQDPGAPS